jgi:hypothetical protein
LTNGNVRKRALCIAGALGLSLTVAGCSGGDDIAALDRAATSQDQLPDYALTPPNVDVGSVRQVLERDGVTYFISKASEGTGFCLTRTKGQDPEIFGTGCSPEAGQVITQAVAGIPETVMLVTDGYDTEDFESEGWTRIHDNLLIADPGTLRDS